MKRYSYTLLFTAVLLCAGFSSCKKSFVEVNQKQRIVATKLEHYDLLMNSVKLYNPDEGGLQAAVLLGDDVAAAADFLNGNGTVETQRLFHYEDVVYDEGKDAGDLKLFLSNLYVCNKVIIEVPDTEGGTEQQKKSLIAEAKATRAWLYMQMVNLYAKPYNANSATADPGFPIIETADITTRSFSRSTVQEVYDFMIKDLSQAIADLPLNQKFPTRMSKPAAEAILGKTYLFMKRFQDALTHFNAAFTGIGQQSNPAKLYDYNIVMGPGGSFLPLDGYNGPNGPGNNSNDFTESVFARTFYEGGYQPIGNDGLILTTAAYGLYNSTDLRRAFYSNTFSTEDPIPFDRVRKHSYTYIKFGIQLPDLYLMRAECQVRLNNLNAGLEDLMTLRRNRMPVDDASVPTATASNQRALLHFIIDERIREFAAEGYRWFDMRRLYNDPLFDSNLPAHIEYDSDGNEIATYPLREARLTLRLPNFYIIANPGMPNNP